jgi:hypothetical protein
MKIKTKGKPSKVQLKLCKDALNFYAANLLGKRLKDKINITLDFTDKEMSPNYYGFCDWEFDNHRSRDFILTIDSTLAKRTMLFVLAHEMVHVKQYAKGELKDYIKAKSVRWHGKIFQSNEIDYWEQPWEIEAHGREKGLYYKFTDYMRKL